MIRKRFNCKQVRHRRHTFARVQKQMFIKIDSNTKPLLSVALKIQLAAFSMSAGWYRFTIASMQYAKLRCNSINSAWNPLLNLYVAVCYSCTPMCICVCVCVFVYPNAYNNFMRTANTSSWAKLCCTTCELQVAAEWRSWKHAYWG